MRPPLTLVVAMSWGLLGVGLAAVPRVFRDWRASTGPGADRVAPTRARLVATRLVGVAMIAIAGWVLVG